MVRARAFTVVELLVALALTAVTASFALPAMQGLVADYRAAAAMNQIVGAVSFARAQAMLLRQTVTLCPASGGACLGRQQWHRGALVFVDRQADGRLDPHDRPLRAFPPLAPGERLYWRAFRQRSYLQFRPRGYTRWQNGSFLYCPPDDDARRARMAIVNLPGRVRQARDRNGDGIVENASGRNVRCPP